MQVPSVFRAPCAHVTVIVPCVDFGSSVACTMVHAPFVHTYPAVHVVVVSEQSVLISLSVLVLLHDLDAVHVVAGGVVIVLHAVPSQPYTQSCSFVSSHKFLPSRFRCQSSHFWSMFCLQYFWNMSATHAVVVVVVVGADLHVFVFESQPYWQTVSAVEQSVLVSLRVVLVMQVFVAVHVAVGADLHAVPSQPYWHVVVVSEQSVLTSLSVLVSVHDFVAVHVFSLQSAVPYALMPHSYPVPHVFIVFVLQLVSWLMTEFPEQYVLK